ncbi:hypothetical protein V8E54_009084, partial [Elaphomyces granulatus]
ELLSVRHTNTAGGGHRNIFVEDGYVVLATRHHKVYKATMNVRVIHRYQPREVGELIIWYLWLVLPFQRVMEQSLWGMDQGTDTSGQSEGRGHLSNNLWPRLASIGPEKNFFYIPMRSSYRYGKAAYRKRLSGMPWWPGKPWSYTHDFILSSAGPLGPRHDYQVLPTMP